MVWHHGSCFLKQKPNKTRTKPAARAFKKARNHACCPLTQLYNMIKDASTMQKNPLIIIPCIGLLLKTFQVWVTIHGNLHSRGVLSSNLHFITEHFHDVAKAAPVNFCQSTGGKAGFFHGLKVDWQITGNQNNAEPLHLRARVRFIEHLMVKIQYSNWLIGKRQQHGICWDEREARMTWHSQKLSASDNWW